MGKRDNWTPEQRERERVANRERMRRIAAADPTYHKRAWQRRKRQQAENPELRQAPRLASKRYYEANKDCPKFWEKRQEYLNRWRAERRIDEEFDAFMDRIMQEEQADGN